MAKGEGPDPRAASAIDVEIGRRIRAYRLAGRVAQEKLAETVGVTFQQIQKYEKGANRVSASMLIKIAAALDANLMDLLPTSKKQSAQASVPDDPMLAEFSALLKRLNAKGRRLLISTAKAFADEDSLRLK